MRSPIEIKGKKFGGGRPVVCIPVTETKKENIIERLKDLGARKVPMVEWRADLYEDLEDPQKTGMILQEVRDSFDSTVFLFTIRTVRQGGNCDLDEKKILYLNQIAAKSGCADFIDLEFFEATKPEKEIRRLQKFGVHVIASHHDFRGTPDKRILAMLMEQMEAGGADIAKLAVMPQCRKDVLALLTLTMETAERFPDLPVVTMSMGGLGTVSRIAGELFGSCITFGAQGAVSAPGQLPADRLEETLDLIHEGMSVPADK